MKPFIICVLVWIVSCNLFKGAFGNPAGRVPYGRGRAAPLDPNQEVAGTLNTLSSLVGVLGHSGSTAVMSLAGVSVTDCAGQLHDKHVETLTCEEFLNAVMECDSMANVKPMLQEAKKRNRKKPNKKAPCYKNKNKKNRKHR